jgi:hypothetical protein
MYSYFTRMYSYVVVFTRMLLVCTRMLLVCTCMLLVCYSYVTRMYSYVLVCYSYVTRMYSCGVLVTIRFKTFLQDEFIDHKFLFCHNNFCGRGVKHIVLHATISSYFSHGLTLYWQNCYRKRNRFIAPSGYVYVTNLCNTSVLLSFDAPKFKFSRAKQYVLYHAHRSYYVKIKCFRSEIKSFEWQTHAEETF